MGEMRDNKSPKLTDTRKKSLLVNVSYVTFEMALLYESKAQTNKGE